MPNTKPHFPKASRKNRMSLKINELSVMKNRRKNWQTGSCALVFRSISEKVHRLLSLSVAISRLPTEQCTPPCKRNRGIDIVGPPPPGAQRITFFAASILVTAKNPEAARDSFNGLCRPPTQLSTRVAWSRPSNPITGKLDRQGTLDCITMSAPRRE